MFKLIIKNTIITVLTLACNLLFAQNILLINEEISEDYLLKGNQIAIYEDTSNSLNINQIRNTNFIIQKNTNSFSYIKNTNSTYWIKFKIKANKELKKQYILENSDSHIDKFELFDNNQHKLNQVIGYSKKFYDRTYQHKNFIFDIYPKQQTQTYYLKIKSSNHNPFIIKIRSTAAFSNYALNEYLLLGLFYGIISIMAIYNFIMYFSFKDKVYIFYVLYVLSAMFISLTEDGLGFQYLWPNSPQINQFITSLAPFLLLFTFIIYAKSFLDIKKYNIKINKSLNVILLIYTTNFIISNLIFHKPINFIFYLIPFSYIYFISLLVSKNGLKYARYFIFAYSIMLFCIIILILRMSGLIHWDNIILVYSFNIGLVFEIVILSVALGDRIKIMKIKHETAQNEIIKQLTNNELLKDKVNRELESKVIERTIKLDEKNQELQSAYLEINRINELLNHDNKELKTNVKELTKARVLMKDVNFEEFNKIFPDKESCTTYLVNLKWAKGYECKKCKNTKWCEGKEEYYRRCTKCRYDESPTAFTIFHKLKFPINKAFYMLFLVYANKEKITSTELSHILALRQITCWTFNKKILEIMLKKKKKSNPEIDGWSQLILYYEEEI